MTPHRGRVALPRWFSLFVASALFGGVDLAAASELTTADRLAMLYTPQLQFSVEGDPLIKIGLIEGETRITFTPSRAIRVLPLGEGGPEITLPADVAYTVERLEGHSGQYRYWSTVARGLPSERERLGEVEAEWQARGFETHRFNLGSIFAVRGTLFDNRQTLVGVGGLADREEASALAETLQSELGVPTDLHVELVDYPAGLLRLSGAGTAIEVTHRDLLWVALAEPGEFSLAGAYFGDAEGEPRRFVGVLIFTLDRRGELAMVNEIPVERLLQGIVPAEIYASAPMDALRSQAVAARGELLADLGVRYLADPYMTCATQRCQVYGGTGAEHPRTTEAIVDTRGEVLIYDDHLARTVYSASNGGSSGDFASTWGDEPLPYLTARIDADEVPEAFRNGLDERTLGTFLDADLDTYGNIENFGGPRVHRWTVELTAEALTATVAERYEEVGRVVDLEVTERDRSGRALRLRVRGRDGEVEVERELAIRRALGGLRSALFVLEVERDGAGELTQVHIRGGGFGHGVGMCQTGSIGAAQRGMDYVAILAHYYPGTEMARLWE